LFRILFETERDHPAAAIAREVLKRYGGVREVADEAQADAIVVARDGGDLQLTTDKGRPLSADLAPGPEQGQRLSEAILHWVRWLRLHAIDNRAVATSGLELEFPRTKGGRFDPGQIGGSVRAGQPHLVTVHNKTETPWFFYVLVLSGDGGVSLLFPPLGAHERLAPRSSWQQALSTCAPKGWREPVYDTIKVVFTREATDFSFLREPAIVRAAPTPEVSPADDWLAHLVGVRGLSSAVLDPRSWVTVQKTLEIRPEPNVPACP
jgi:hypothetical protein